MEKTVRMGREQWPDALRPRCGEGEAIPMRTRRSHCVLRHSWTPWVETGNKAAGQRLYHSEATDQLAVLCHFRPWREAVSGLWLSIYPRQTLVFGSRCGLVQPFYSLGLLSVWIWSALKGPSCSDKGRAHWGVCQSLAHAQKQWNQTTLDQDLQNHELKPNIIIIFFSFETGFLCVALAGLELALPLPPECSD